MPDAHPIPNNLYEAIASTFSLEELKGLCFDLHVNDQNLPGETLLGKARELVQYLERYNRLPELLPRLKELRPHMAWDSYQPAEPEAHSPFKGLHYFDESDAHLFFGREKLTAELVDHLRQHRFLAVVGASGSGKSSLVRAGVVPIVRRGLIEGVGGSRATWPIHVITPGDEPLKALAASLTRESESVTATATLWDDLRHNSQSLDLFLYRQMSDKPEGRLLLVVDQFEELFTQCDDAEERRLLVENLVQAVQSGKQGRLSLILTLRADFYAYAVQYEGLRPLLETRQKIVGAMNPDELRRAIEAPAEQGNWQFQPGLVETILQDVGREPGALPLLSHALQETWARREGRVMTLAGYQAAGGVRRAIAQTASTVYASLTPAQQTIARNIFLRLTELGEGTEDTRRRASLSELLPQDDTVIEVQATLNYLARKRLLILNEERTKEGATQIYAEVAHEALIREWPALRNWLDENREGLRLQRQLTDMAEAWQATHEDSSYLIRGGRLTQIQEWTDQHPANLNYLEHRFLIASQEAVTKEHAEQEAQRQRELAAEKQRTATVWRASLGLALLLVIALLAAVMAVRASLRADERTRITLSQALAASSQNVREQDPMEALLLAISAGQTAETTLAMDALNRQVPVMAKPLLTLSHEGPVSGAMWNEAENQILSWGNDSMARVWDAITGSLLLTLSHEGSVSGAMWNEVESRILTWSFDRTVRIWDATTGNLLLTMSHEDWVYGAVWNEAQSQILSWGGDEVRVWDAPTGNLLLTLSHENSVSDAVWNKADSQILTWSDNSTARVWDAATGDLLLTLSHESTDYSSSGAMWNEVGSQILTWGDDRTARVWSASTGDPLLTLSHEDSVYGAVWNKVGSQILTWGGDGARVWDATTGDLLQTFSHEGPFHSVYGAVWNEAESQILTWGGDGVRMWEATTGDLLLTLSREGSISGAVWNEAQSQILTWSLNSTVHVWSTSTSTLLLALSHEGSVLSLSGAMWNEAGNQILSWSNDSTVRVWDATTTSNPLLTLSHEGSVSGAVWNKAESQILTWGDDRTARVWDATTGKPLLTFNHEEPVSGAVWNKAESQILTWSYNSIARVWNATTGKPLLTFNHEDSVSGAVWNEAESQILTWSDDRTARVWDATTGNPLLTLSHENSVSGAVWNEVGSQILTWSDDRRVRVWDATTGNLLLALSHENSVYDAIWNEAGSRILTWGSDGARVWDVATGNLLLTFIHKGPFHSESGAMWNQAESQILIWSADDNTRVWDASTGDLLLTLSYEASVYSGSGAVWNEAESQILIWSYDAVRVWSATTGALLLTLSHEGVLKGAMWNEAESQILSWGGDAVRVWDVSTGELLLTLRGDGNSVTAAWWNQTESRILLATAGGFIRVYYTHTTELAEQACHYATRNFTWQEWQFYFLGQPYQQTCPYLPVHPSVPESSRP